MWERADEETIKRRMALARGVREDLAAAGFPLTPGHFHEPALTCGVNVSTDEANDGSGSGVYVEWETHNVLRSASMHAVFSGRSDEPSVEYNGTVHSAMEDALFAILTAAGYTVEKGRDEYAPYRLDISDHTPRTPSWREWLAEQRDAETKLMHATHRRERGGE
jgi:hypothetical protein